MGALFTVGYWIVLVTLIPGLVTTAVLFCALSFVDPSLIGADGIATLLKHDWVFVAIVVAVMTQTQALGILLEELFIKLRLLGRSVIAPQGIDPYEQYGHLYYHLSEMTKDDDPHGHLRRSIVQFFLTLNTLVSFLIGIVVVLAVGLSAGRQHPEGLQRTWLFVAGLGGFVVIDYLVARIRFREMARSIWTARRSKLTATESDDN